MTDSDLRAEVAAVVRKMLYPSPLMHWMEGLAQAERIGRIKKSKQSVLRYGVRYFLMAQISTQVTGVDGYKLTITPMDDEVYIELVNRNAPGNIEMTVAYPDWLLDFLDDDENFALMVPGCEEKLGEVLQRIYEWCLEHPPYDILVRPS